MKAKSPFKKEVYQRNAKIYRVLANAKRLEILNTVKHAEASVGALADILHSSSTNVSQHLAVLRHAGLVKTRRDGQTIYYEIIDPQVIESCRILKEFFESRRGK